MTFSTLARLRRPRLARIVPAALAVWAALAGHRPAAAQDWALTGAGLRALEAPFVTEAHPDGGSSGPAFGGSFASFRFHDYAVEGGNHTVYIRQSLASGRSATAGFSSRSASHLRTDTLLVPPRDFHETAARAFVVYQGFSGLAPQTRWQSFSAVVRDGHLAAEMTVGHRILLAHACRVAGGCAGPGGQPYSRVSIEPFWTVGGSRTEAAGEGTGRFFRPIIPYSVATSEWVPGFPVELEDGFATGDPSPGNHVHVATYNHRYYMWSLAMPLDCGAQPCRLLRDERTWSAHGHTERWGAQAYREEAPLAVFDIIPVGAAGVPRRPPPVGRPGVPASGGARWHVCMGATGPGTPCHDEAPDPAACRGPADLGRVYPEAPWEPAYRCSRIVVACFLRFPVSTPEPGAPAVANPGGIAGSRCGACCKKDMDDLPAAYAYAASRREQYGCLAAGYGLFQVVGEGAGGYSGGWYSGSELRVSMDHSDPAYAGDDIIERYVPRGRVDGQEVCWGTEGYAWVRHLPLDLPRTCPAGSC